MRHCLHAFVSPDHLTVSVAIKVNGTSVVSGTFIIYDCERTGAIHPKTPWVTHSLSRLFISNSGFIQVWWSLADDQHLSQYCAGKCCSPAVLYWLYTTWFSRSLQTGILGHYLYRIAIVLVLHQALASTRMPVQSFLADFADFVARCLVVLMLWSIKIWYRLITGTGWLFPARLITVGVQRAYWWTFKNMHRHVFKGQIVHSFTKRLKQERIFVANFFALFYLNESSHGLSSYSCDLLGGAWPLDWKSLDYSTWLKCKCNKQ